MVIDSENVNWIELPRNGVQWRATVTQELFRELVAFLFSQFGLLK
jgi:hypothetical protein